MSTTRDNLRRDVGIIITSIVVAVLLADSGVLASVGEWRFIGSFLAGVFFISLFTAAPATVVLVEIAKVQPVLEVAVFGGLGALVGDFLILRFIEDRLSKDILGLMKKSRREGFAAVFKLKFVRWLAPIIGAVIVASPFPDEIGLALMGLSKMKMVYFIPVSFALNFLGILVLSLIARALW